MNRRAFLGAGLREFPRWQAAPSAPVSGPEDITAQAGLDFTHNSGAFGTKYLPETLGPGARFRLRRRRMARYSARERRRLAGPQETANGSQFARSVSE